METMISFKEVGIILSIVSLWSFFSANTVIDCIFRYVVVFGLRWVVLSSFGI